MKLNKTSVFIGIAIVSLLSILFIQINWMLDTARIKQEIFNEKANMVLQRTAEVVVADEATCRGIDEGIDQKELNTIDSVFKHYMKYYKLKVDYVFEVKKPNQFANALQQHNSIYQTKLESINIKEGIDLRLVFPDKKQYILAELRTPFITSILLIVVVIILFIKTVKAIVTEKNLSLRTSDFLSNMTHEFKTPITNIALATKFLNKEFNDSSSLKSREYAEIILEENEKLRLQVEQVLSIASLEKGEIPLLRKELDVHALLKQVVSHMNLQLENNEAEIIWQLGAKEYQAFLDVTHMSNVFRNLIDNAIKYSNSSIRINIKTYNAYDNLMVEISDNGIGIDKKYHSSLFDNYFRVPMGDVHNVKGFGLGLSYVKRVLDLHDAEIQVASELHKGSIFKIILKNVE
jgi:two-component system phosphate regulon sensor histidine kinase PhoR